MGDATDDRGMRRTFIVPAIKSFDHYDFTRAKISCSLTWLVAKAFGSDAVPEDLVEPLYRDQYKQEHLKPPVACLLQSAELYCRAGSLILRSDAVKPLLGHNAVIQALAQKGLYVTDQDRLVTERDLTSTPIHMSSHLALIDTLMMAYTVEMVSVERVMSCINRYSSADPSHGDGNIQELPYDTEDAIATWINKAGAGPAEERSVAPLVENLLKDNTDGCALTALLHFYCPQAIRLEDICLKETMSLADSLYNLQLVQEFCRNNLNHCCHFSLEDMLYAHASIKPVSLCPPVEIWLLCPVLSNRAMQTDLTAREHPFTGSSSRGISFEIPLDGEPTLPSGGMTRSASSDGLGFKVHYASRGSMKRHLSLMPVDVNGQSRHIPEEDDEFTSQKSLGQNNMFSIKNQSRYSNGVLPESNHSHNDHHGNHSGHISPSSPPSIEEALKIIHDTERPHACLGSGDGDDGFFLHGAEPSDPPGAHGPGDDLGPAKARPNDHDPNSLSTDEVDTGIHVRTEDIQSLDEDSSSLRDYSDIDQDCEAMTRSCPLPDQPERENERSRPGGGEGVGQTNPEGGRGTVGTALSQYKHPPSTDPHTEPRLVLRRLWGHGPYDELCRAEVQEAGGKEQRRNNPREFRPQCAVHTPAKSLSAQISTPPLQSHLPLQQRLPPDPSHLIATEMIQLRMKLEEKRRAIEAQKKKVEAAFTRHRQKMGRTAFLNVVRRKGITAPLSPSSAAAEAPSPEPLSASKETRQGSMEGAERCKPDGARLDPPVRMEQVRMSPGEIDLTEYTRSIDRLNTSLGFLQTEMQRLAQQQERIMSMREQQQQSWVIPPPAPSPHRQLRELRSSSVTGRGSGRGSVGSLSPILSSSGSPHAPNRSPAGLKRRPASFHARTPRTPRPNDLKVTPFSRMLNTQTSVDSLPRLRRFNPSQNQNSSFAYLGHDEGPPKNRDQEARDNNESTKDKEEDVERKSAGTPQATNIEAAKEREDEGERKSLLKPSGSSELVKEPPSDLRPAGRPPLGQEMAGEGEGEGEAGADMYGEDQKMCCGFFFKDDVKGEEDMAAKKAALLEKRLRREKETQEKKHEQELDQEQKREAARLKAEEDQLKKDDDKARKEYIKYEYLRRKQLKLMEDMDDVIKPRTGSLKKKPRPKSIHRDVVESAPPVRATGPKLYKEPSAKSNKHIIQNALAHCCLAGKVNEGQKNKILDEMEKSEANNFLVCVQLLPETEEITKLAGIGPRSITTKMIEGLYKYNSDRKQFSQIPAKTMSASVDAITIASHLWQTKKQGTPKKLHTK
ncbi:hypothetical protein F7725_011568 [Dissostichus mawsoni]|uniref:Calmodulin-regulated spectrin-associated protein 2-like n=1 Tax=Dissostichus mawsoni TaxID=36200 RepID=A0A7J5ZCG3_DISMA|nr:hypothetical protein F7725_011568 [Dissostichus mawsoni]